MCVIFEISLSKFVSIPKDVIGLIDDCRVYKFANVMASLSVCVSPCRAIGVKYCESEFGKMHASDV